LTIEITTIQMPTKLKTLMKPYWKTNRAIFFDVSTKSTGWAAWDYYNGFIRYGVLQADSRESVLERICKLSAMANQLLNELKITTAGIAIFIEEGVFKSKKTAMLLGEARGAIMAAVRDRATCIKEVGNGAWKKFLRVQVGEAYDKEEKVHAHRNLEKILETSVSVTHYGKETTYDESDALGGLLYALCAIDLEEEE